MAKNSPIQLVEYQSDWPKAYIKIADKIVVALGRLIIAVEHVGSTAIPQMPAKDIIDLQVGVKDFSNIELIHTRLAPLGFTFVPQIKQDHVPFKDFDEFEEGYEKRFFKGDIEGRACNLHLRQFGDKNWNFALQFRDFLRNNHKAATAYRQVKERMRDAKLNGQDYCLIKDPVCDLIYILFSSDV